MQNDVCSMRSPHPPVHLFPTNSSDDPGSPDGDGGSLCNIHSLALALEQHVRPHFYFSIALLCMFCSGTVLLQGDPKGNLFLTGPKISKKCYNLMVFRELIKGSFGILRCQVY